MFGMPSGSEIQWWLGAIQGRSANYFWVIFEKYAFLVCPRDLKFNGGLLRFKVMLEITSLFYFRHSVFFGMPSGSEIQLL